MKKVYLLAAAAIPLTLFSCNREELKISIIGENEIYIGVSTKYNVSLNSKFSGFTYVWSSSDENVATIDQKGILKGISEGETTITVTVKNRDNLTASKKVKVNNYLKELTQDEFVESYKTFTEKIVSGEYSKVAVDPEDYAYDYKTGEKYKFAKTSIRYDAKLYSRIYKYAVTAQYGGATFAVPYTIHIGTDEDNIRSFIKKMEDKGLTFGYYKDATTITIAGSDDEGLAYLHTYNQNGYLTRLLDYEESGGVRSSIVSCHFTYSK